MYTELSDTSVGAVQVYTAVPLALYVQLLSLGSLVSSPAQSAVFRKKCFLSSDSLEISDQYLSALAKQRQRKCLPEQLVMTVL